MRTLAPVLLAAGLCACGGFSVPTQPGGGGTGRAGPVRIETSTVERAPGGGLLQVTLISYDPRVREPSGNRLVPLVAGATVRLHNSGSEAIRLGPPTRYATLELLAKFGASAIMTARGPCAGRFAATPLRLGAGATIQGCLAFAYTEDDPPFQFLFGLRKGAEHGWNLPS